MPKNVLVHNYKDYLNDKFRNDLIELKKKININIGVSIYNDSEIIKVLEKHQPDVVQLPINAINKKLYSTGLIRLLKEQKIIIQSRSFFSRSFFKNENIIKEKLKPLYKPLLKLKRIAKDNNMTLSELSLKFVNSINEINKIVIGVNSENQLRNNINIIKEKASKN